MKKRAIVSVLLAVTMVCLVACKPNGTGKIPDESTDGKSDESTVIIEDKLYIRGRPGFGDNFMLLLRNDGSYAYYVGSLSSYLGMGTWSEANGILTLNESSDNGKTFRFSVKNGDLFFISEGSSEFAYVTVKDGDRFCLQRDKDHDAKKYVPDYETSNTHNADLFLETLKRDGYHNGDKMDKNYNTDGISLVVNITPRSISENEPELEVFYIRPGYHCFMMYKGEIYRYDNFALRHHKLALWDYDGNGIKDLVTYCSGGSGISYLGVYVTDLTTMKEQSVFVSGLSYGEPGFYFDCDGESIFINGEKVTYSNGEFHCGDQF